MLRPGKWKEAGRDGPVKNLTLKLVIEVNRKISFPPCATCAGTLNQGSTTGCSSGTVGPLTSGEQDAISIISIRYVCLGRLRCPIGLYTVTLPWLLLIIRHIH